MQSVPTPIVMVSSLTQAGADTTIRALEAGAVECIAKPSGSGSDSGALAGQLTDAVHRASRSRVTRRRNVAIQPAAAALRPSVAVSSRIPAHNVLVLGASTGGPPALTQVLSRLPADLVAAVLVVQHMPAGFTGALARRLDALCALPVSEASGGESITAGHIFVAPGDFHMLVTPDRRIQLEQSEPVHGVRPSIDVTLASVASAYGRRASVAILTGMGRDGADGAVLAEQAGGRIIVQDEASCVVYGMPRVAKERTREPIEAPLDGIAEALVGVLASSRAG
jgi:two-component system, chemotaxis family, protein-glutamate methylesterase/glutaminase